MNRKLKKGMLLVASVVLLGSLYLSGNLKERVTSLKRNPYGQGDITYSLQLEQGNEIKEVQICIEEMQPEIEDWEIYKIEAIRYAKEEFVRAVESLTPEQPMLQLPENYKDGEITWKSLSQPAADDSGYVWFALLEEKKLLYEGTVILNEFRETFRVEANICYENEMESIENLIQAKLNQQEGMMVMLPDRLEDQEIGMYRSTGEWLLFPAILAGGVILWFLAGEEFAAKKRKEMRIRKIYMEFPLFISKMILYLRAGMSVRSAWEKLILVLEGKRPNTVLLSEMIYTRNQIYSGVSEGRAYEEFGIRCENYSYKRVGMFLSQAVEKNGETLLTALEEELEHFYLEKTNQARKKGEEAGTKLLIPTGIQFLFLMLSLMIPALLLFET